MCIRDRIARDDGELLRLLIPHDAGAKVRGEGVRRQLIFLAVSYTHLRAHETVLDLVCRLLLEKKKIEQTKEHD